MEQIRYIYDCVMSFLCKLFTFLISRKWINGCFSHSYCINRGKHNSIRVSSLQHGKLSIAGNNNVVALTGSLLYCNIYIEGDNNNLTILNGCKIGNTEIWIRSSNGNITIGENTQIMGSTIVCQGKNNYITIGKDCLFSTNIDIWNSDTHQILNLDGDVINKSKPVTIGDHVWLGKNVTVLKGVNIGPNTVIGMASIITKDVDSNMIVAGMPPRIIKDNINWSINHIED